MKRSSKRKAQEPASKRPAEIPDGIEKLLAGKERRRKQLARLPILEKLKILLGLQKAENEIRRAAGRKPKREWEI